MIAFVEVEGLSAGYGRTRVLENVSLRVEEGARVCILGGNGSGKSTLLKTIVGLLQQWSGEVRFAGHSLKGMPAHERFHAGIAYVPQDRQLFRQKTVFQNLELGCLSKRYARPDFVRILNRVLDTLPLLRERLDTPAGLLSGGEQQVVAIGRSLMSQPRLLLLDEPSAGLSPIWLQRVADALHSAGSQFSLTIMLVEQKVDFGFDLTERAYVIRNGVVVMEGACGDLKDDPVLLRSYLG
jgi:branched-chain amino acid transport system ATP-binding protein